MSPATFNLVAVKVPSVGESITSGVIGSWKRKNGDSVASGDPLFEIETDKVTSEVFAETSGTLEILVAEGTEVKVGQVVAHILPGKGPAKSKSNADDTVEAVVPNRPSTTSKPEPSVNVNLTVNDHLPSSSGSDVAPRTFRAGKESRRRMSPLRRKIADRLVSAQH
ncbi:MAG: biotin/lipoyl-containing protein, partial [Verrucomicrobiota bacterium]